MGLDTLAQIGEFVGGVFVVVSLIYLALQVRQNTRSVQTENYARVLERMSTLQSRISADPDLNRLFVIGAEHPERLSRADRLRFSWALYEMFGAAEFMYHQTLQNALPPAVWERWDATIAWWLSHPGMRAWWAAKPTPLARDFQTYGDEILRTRRMEAGALERWHAFVAWSDLPAGREAAVKRPA